MLLTIDVRTTSIELGLFSGSGAHAKLARHWRIHTNPLLTADEFAMQVRGLVGAHLDEVVGVAALSTVPPVLRELRLMLDRYWNHVPHVVVEPGVRTGIPLLVDNPKEVGADRIVNSLAAYDKFATAAIVIDFGVSTCVDLVSAKGEFLGGVLAPGWRSPPRRSSNGRRCAGSSWHAHGRWSARTPWSAFSPVRCSASPAWWTAWSTGSAMTWRRSRAMTSRWWPRERAHR